MQTATLINDIKNKQTKRSHRSLEASGTGLQQYLQNYCYKIKQNIGTYVSVLSKEVDINIVLEADRSFAGVTNMFVFVTCVYATQSESLIHNTA